MEHTDVHRLAPPLLKMTLFRMEWLNIHGARRSKPFTSLPQPFECVTERQHRAAASRDASKKPAELESGLMTILAADEAQVSDQGCCLGVLAGLHCWHLMAAEKHSTDSKELKHQPPSPRTKIHYQLCIIFLSTWLVSSHIVNFCRCFHRSVINLIGLSCVLP